MIAIKIKATKELLDNIIEAYNKEYKESITVMDVKSLVRKIFSSRFNHNVK